MKNKVAWSALSFTLLLAGCAVPPRHGGGGERPFVGPGLTASPGCTTRNPVVCRVYVAVEKNADSAKPWKVFVYPERLVTNGVKKNDSVTIVWISLNPDVQFVRNSIQVTRVTSPAHGSINDFEDAGPADDDEGSAVVAGKGRNYRVKFKPKYDPPRFPDTVDYHYDIGVLKGGVPVPVDPMISNWD